MNEQDKFAVLIGGVFFPTGAFVIVMGALLLHSGNEIEACMVVFFLGAIFCCLGGGVLLTQMKKANKRKKVATEGIIYTGKIYGYVEDKTCTINDSFPINTKVRYFDEDGKEREVIIKTGFLKGNGDFPIGATIDIKVLGVSTTWVPGSVRYEHISREEELMDDKPINQVMNMTAVVCDCCGASFTAAKGYVSKCPYCGASINC